MFGGRGGYDAASYNPLVIETMAKKVLEHTPTGSLLIIYMDDEIGKLSKQTALNTINNIGRNDTVFTWKLSDDYLRTLTIGTLLEEQASKYPSIWVLAKAREINRWKEGLGVTQILKNDELIVYDLEIPT